MIENEISGIIQDFLANDVKDGISFTYKRIEPIREDDEYNYFCKFFDAEYGKIKNPMKIDITTGDEITPAEIQNEYPFLFYEGTILC